MRLILIGIKQNGRDDVITFAIENYVASLKSKIQSGEPLSEADFDWDQTE